MNNKDKIKVIKEINKLKDYYNKYQLEDSDFDNAINKITKEQ